MSAGTNACNVRSKNCHSVSSMDQWIITIRSKNCQEKSNYTSKINSERSSIRFGNRSALPLNDRERKGVGVFDNDWKCTDSQPMLPSVVDFSSSNG